MLDVFNLMSDPNVNIQYFEGMSATTLTQWQTWRKPRGVKMVYMIGVGGGSSGGCGLNTAATSGGGAGGGSGAQSTLIIPATYLPDILYVQAGQGGRQPATLVSAAVGVAGTITLVAIEPYTVGNTNATILSATGGLVTGTAATTTAGGLAGTNATLPLITNQPLAGRGVYQFLAGQAGAAGGASTPTAGANVTIPTTGLMVTGGAGGGGSTTTAAAGGSITGAGFQFFPTLTGGTAAVTSTPAGNSQGAFKARNFLLNYGGAGGGAATTVAGGLASAGGNGAPGCGGGGAGGSNTTNATLARPGDGGPGFVLILSW